MSELDGLLAAEHASTSERDDDDIGATSQSCGHDDGVVVVEVVGEDDAPMAGVVVEVVLDSRGASRGSTDRLGRARFEGLPEGEYTVSLHALDRDAWCELDRGQLPTEEATAKASVTWEEVAPSASRQVCTVTEGECAAKLAERFGLRLATVWDHPDNAELRAQRVTPYVLLAGDTLVMPAHRRGELTVSTGAWVRCRRLGVPEVLRMRFVDPNGEPRGGLAYLVHLELHEGTPVADHTGILDGGGRLELSVPPSTVRATVQLTATDGSEEEYALQVGYLDPIDTPTGLRDRLSNLGLPHDEDPGVEEQHAKLALRELQHAEGKTPTGELDPTTRSTLDRMYSC